MITISTSNWSKKEKKRRRTQRKTRKWKINQRKTKWSILQPRSQLIRFNSKRMLRNWVKRSETSTKKLLKTVSLTLVNNLSFTWKGHNWWSFWSPYWVRSLGCPLTRGRYHLPILRYWQRLPLRWLHATKNRGHWKRPITRRKDQLRRRWRREKRRYCRSLRH